MSARLSANKAELCLTLHALFFSTVHFKPLAAWMAACGLIFASSRSCSLRSILPLFLPLALGVIISVAVGSAPGPTMEALGVLLGAAGWFMTGQEKLMGRGTYSAIAALSLSTLAIAEYLMTGSSARLWMISPIDLGLAILLTGIFGMQAPFLAGCLSRTLPYFTLILLAVGLSTSRSLAIAAAAALLILLPLRRPPRMGEGGDRRHGVSRESTDPAGRGDGRSDLRYKIAILSLFLCLSTLLIMRRLGSDPFSWHRFSLYASTANLIQERPWTGWGFGSYDAVSRRALLPDPSEIKRMRIPIHAHCDPLELIMEIGLPLGSLVLAAWLALLFQSIMANRRVECATLTAVSLVSLFYFPVHLVYPLYHALYAAGASFQPLPLRSRIPGIALGIVLLVYAYGLALRSPLFAPFDARIAIESNADNAVEDFVRLEPEKPEALLAAAKHAAMSRSPDLAILGFSAAVARAPMEAPPRFELARAWLWRASQSSDTATILDSRRRAAMELGFIRAAEPLQLAAIEASGDSHAFVLAQWALEKLERSEPRVHIDFMRRRIDL